jgi:GlpG protein
MRLAGKIADQHDASTVVDYLLTRGIGARAEANDGAWQIWILDEDRVAEGKQVLTEFAANPRDEIYRAASKAADRLRREEVDRAIAAKKNVVRLGNSVGAYRGRRPVTMMLLAACAVVFALTDFASTNPQTGRFTKEAEMDKLSMSNAAGPEGEYVGLPEVARGEYWRLLTPILLHFSLVHFVFNMIWLVDFGTQIENRTGSLGFLGLVLVSALASNFTQLLWSGPGFGGFSGVNFAMFGFIWMKAYYEPWKGYLIRQSTVIIQVAYLFLCMTGRMGNIANGAHVGGLLAGMAIGFAPTLWRRLLGK